MIKLKPMMTRINVAFILEVVDEIFKNKQCQASATNEEIKF
jgi:hypothetical protein